MNLLIYSVLNLAFCGGFERWVKEVAPRLLEKGHKAHVITTKAGDIKDPYIKNYLTGKGVTITELDNLNKPLIIPRHSCLKTLLNVTKDRDVIYFYNAFSGNDVLMRLIKGITNIKIVAGYRGLYPSIGSWLRRLYQQTINKNVSKSFDACHVVNRDTKKLLYLLGYKNIYCIPNGVDTLKFKPSQKEERFTVLFVGRLDYQKGFDIFAQIVEHLNMHYERDIKFVICGEGILSHLTRKLCRYSNVKWLGWKNYYKYAPLIYEDPEILIPLPKGLLRGYWRKGVPVEQLRLVFNEAAKHIAERLVRRAPAGGRNLETLRNPGKLWLSLSRDLQIK